MTTFPSYRKSAIKPSGGRVYFKHIFFWGGGAGGYLIEERWWYQFSIKNYIAKWISSSTRSWRSCLQLVNKPFRIRVLQSWLFNTVYHLWVKNNKGEGRVLKERGESLLTFFPWKKGGLIRETVLHRGFKLCAGTFRRNFILAITSVFAGHYWRFSVG